MRHLLTPCVVTALLGLVLIGPAFADAEKPAKSEKEPEGLVPKAWLAQMPWRSIGPGNMGGRITSLAVNAKDPSMWWAATASGGLLKTVNNGTTFEHQFDKERVVSIGDVAVSQSNPEIVWVGTGECNPRNSVSWGNGVYKSVDGGKTWKHMGLKGTFQIGAVRIHPENPDVVYVGALGRLWGHNEERGLYKTADGGKTWKRIHYVDEKTGVIDVQMHPNDPDTLLVATWERQRGGFDVNAPTKKWGPGTGLYKTTDGGKTFKHITKGLPSCQIGRIGLDYYRKNPEVVFMVLETEKIGQEPPNAPFMGVNGRDADAGARLTAVTKGGPAMKAGLKKDDIVLSVDGKTIHSWTDLLREIRQHVKGDKVKLEVSRARKGVEIDLKLGSRPKPKAEKEESTNAAAMRRPRGPFGAFLGGQQPNLQDQQGKEGYEYGGVYKSTDGGESWTRINSVNPRPMYFSEIRVDPTDEKKLWLLGIRLWKSVDGGAKFTPDGHGRGVHVDHHALWIDPSDSRHMILGNDGGIYVTHDAGKSYRHLNNIAIGQFYDVGVGPRRDYRVYGGLQDNGSWGGPSRARHGSGPTNEDWIRIGGGDGFRVRIDKHDPEQVYFQSQYGGIARRHLESGERRMMKPRAPKGSTYRFNWSTPFLLSHHNSRIYYAAGNKVFKSVDRGNGMRAISPDITVTKEGSASTLAESPRDPLVLWVGTDDGGVWMTKDGGHTWTDIYAKPDPTVKKRKATPPKEPTPPPMPKEPSSARGDHPRPEGGKPPADATSDPANGNGDHKNGNGNGDEPKKAETPKPSPRAQRFLDRVMRRDENGDGVLQKAELPERMAGAIKTFDKNADGALDRDELLAAMSARPGRSAARGDRPRRSGPRAKAPKKTPAGKPLAEIQPDRRWVSWIEPSRFETGRAYMTFDGHRSDDERVTLYVTEDFGKSWRSIRSNLPDWAGPARVLREDLVNKNLLYLGTEFGAWVSVDRGESWTSLNSNLPTVAVHAFALHPTAGEIVAGTHGRSLWVLDVTALRQMTSETVKADAHLYKPNVAIQWRPQPSRGRTASFVGTNPATGAVLCYSLAKKTPSVKLEVATQDGSVIKTLEAKGDAGLHRVVWNLRRDRKPGARRRFGARVKPGTYQAVLTVGEKRHTQDVVVEMDPEHVDPGWMEHEDLAEERAAAKAESRVKRHLPQGTDRDE